MFIVLLFAGEFHQLVQQNYIKGMFVFNHSLQDIFQANSYHSMLLCADALGFVVTKPPICLVILEVYFEGSVQERHNSIANALELHLFCTDPSI